MINAFRTMLVVMTVVLAFVAMSAFASGDCDEIVEGTVTEINVDANIILVDGITVKGVPLVYLANQYNIVLEAGVSEVVITGYLCPLSGYVRACSISVDGGAVIDLPGR